jgi:hypothetical protein
MSTAKQVQFSTISTAAFRLLCNGGFIGTGRRPVLPPPPERASIRSKYVPSCPERIGQLGSLTPLHIAAW